MTNPYESPRSVDAELEKQIARAVAQDGTLAGVYWALSGTAMVLSTVFAIAVIGTRNHVPRIFDSFDADLPALTQLFVSMGFAFIVSLLCVSTIAKERILKSKAACALWNTVTIILVLVLAALYSAALVLPIIQIGEKLA